MVADYSDPKYYSDSDKKDPVNIKQNQIPCAAWRVVERQRQDLPRRLSQLERAGLPCR